MNTNDTNNPVRQARDLGMAVALVDGMDRDHALRLGVDAARRLQLQGKERRDYIRSYLSGLFT